MIEARGLVKRYGGTAAVDDLSFTIRPGQVTGFLGPNGAGKTTTMRLILGLDYPSAGTVTVNGRPYAGLASPMHEVGALLDAGAVHGGRTARSHLLCLAQANGIARSRVEEVLGLTGLTSVAGRPPAGGWPGQGGFPSSARRPGRPRRAPPGRAGRTGPPPGRAPRRQPRWRRASRSARRSRSAGPPAPARCGPGQGRRRAGSRVAPRAW